MIVVPWSRMNLLVRGHDAHEEAERCWKIFPPKAAENVVPMAMAS
jgi:hypothetical protein